MGTASLAALAISCSDDKNDEPTIGGKWSTEFGGEFVEADKEIAFAGEVTADDQNKITKVKLTAGGLTNIFISSPSSIFKDNPQTMDVETFTLTGVFAKTQNICEEATGPKDVEITAEVYFSNGSILPGKKTVSIVCNPPVGGQWTTEFDSEFVEADKEIALTGTVTADDPSKIINVRLTANGSTKGFRSVENHFFKENSQDLEGEPTITLDGIFAKTQDICGETVDPKDVEITADVKFSNGTTLSGKKTVTIICDSDENE